MAVPFEGWVRRKWGFPKKIAENWPETASFRRANNGSFWSRWQEKF
jgi:hypothetical protein